MSANRYGCRDWSELTLKIGNRFRSRREVGWVIGSVDAVANGDWMEIAQRSTNTGVKDTRLTVDLTILLLAYEAYKDHITY